jgi:hypothetical protein
MDLLTQLTIKALQGIQTKKEQDTIEKNEIKKFDSQNSVFRSKNAKINENCDKKATSFCIPESDNSEEDIDNVPVCDKNKSDKFSTLGKRK